LANARTRESVIKYLRRYWWHTIFLKVHADESVIKIVYFAFNLNLHLKMLGARALSKKIATYKLVMVIRHSPV